MTNLLRLMTSKIILVLYIIYEILIIIAVILEESIFGLLRKIRGKKEEVKKKVIGKSIMDPVQNLKKI